MCREAVDAATGLKVLGYLPKRHDLTLPERHLGLVPTPENPLPHDFIDKLTSQIEKTVDLNGLLHLARKAAPPKVAPSLFPRWKLEPSVRIGIARDKAFSFYYQDNLDLLEAWGAELVPFSPLGDSALPSDIGGVYMGGGFPEMYAAELAQNRSMLTSIREAGRKGLPIYAECGGLMYLGRSLSDFDGIRHKLVGLLPVESSMKDAKLKLGYRTVRALADNPVLQRGEEVRGHEFHWSQIGGESKDQPAYLILEQKRKEGFCIGSTLASYIHLHFASRPGMAQRFISYCEKRGE
jgi:cobyrinic acid a,c-diamide synthase